MIYQEVQRFSVSLLLGIGLFVIVLAGFIVAFAVKADRLMTFVMISVTFIPICALYLLFRLETRVSARELAIRLFPMPERRILKSDIASTEVIQYRPIQDFGGWGLRHGRGGKIYSARGNWAVKLNLRSGSTVYVGTGRPDDLSRSLC